jgi:hypothetical protein
VDGREDFDSTLAGSERRSEQGDWVMGIRLQDWCTSTYEQGGEELEKELMAVHQVREKRGQLSAPGGRVGCVGDGEA